MQKLLQLQVKMKTLISFIFLCFVSSTAWTQDLHELDWQAFEKLNQDYLREHRKSFIKIQGFLDRENKKPVLKRLDQSESLKIPITASLKATLVADDLDRLSFLNKEIFGTAYVQEEKGTYYLELVSIEERSPEKQAQKTRSFQFSPVQKSPEQWTLGF